MTYLCIGVNCWGKGPDRQTAIKNAKANYSKTLFGKWSRYILYTSTDPDIFVDDMGHALCKENAKVEEVERRDK